MCEISGSPKLTPERRVPPRLETDRLILRAHEASDFSACAAMWRDSRVVKYTIGTAAPPQSSWQRLLAYRGHWLLLGFGYWAVELRATGGYIGELGFADFHRDPAYGLEGIPELGWALCPQAHGRGYATEGLYAAVEWADGSLDARRTACIVHRDNAVSLHLAEKLGYATRLRAAADEAPHIVLSRDSCPPGPTRG